MRLSGYSAVMRLSSDGARDRARELLAAGVEPSPEYFRNLLGQILPAAPLLPDSAPPTLPALPAPLIHASELHAADD